ncbi:hypothetical protein [Methanobrevibacter filiformis]|uniref:Uncharacterized protein n=1 Tax=Methanobrevibacter filiformis TaxID=55758 RepID=A0A166FAH8_9EURY|nr:hypothetical protein [Methanobrevibacter filiformis]KZX17469.1 hypothetical protein MBFIL_01270 [Methanobrevibacter filiformis]
MITNPDIALEKIQNYLENERKNTEGLLSDVKAIYQGEDIDHQPKIPYLWLLEEIIEQDTEMTTFDEEWYSLSLIICAVCYNPQDLTKSYKESKNLAVRAGQALEKQFTSDNDSYFESIEFINFSPSGVHIEGASDRVHQSSVSYTCLFKEKTNNENSTRFERSRISGDIRRFKE